LRSGTGGGQAHEVWEPARKRAAGRCGIWRRLGAPRVRPLEVGAVRSLSSVHSRSAGSGSRDTRAWCHDEARGGGWDAMCVRARDVLEQRPATADESTLQPKLQPFSGASLMAVETGERTARAATFSRAPATPRPHVAEWAYCERGQAAPCISGRIAWWDRARSSLSPTRHPHSRPFHREHCPR
jgi:hypothetical protein